MNKRIIIDTGNQAPQLFIVESYAHLNEISDACNRFGFRLDVLRDKPNNNEGVNHRS
jgi:hypothetical protein